MPNDNVTPEKSEQPDLKPSHFGAIKTLRIQDLDIRGVALHEKMLVIKSGTSDQNYFVAYEIDKESATELIKALRSLKWKGRKKTG